MEEETKKCTKCGEVKSVLCFHKGNKYKDGLSVHCKKCKATSNKERLKKKLQRNPNHFKEIYKRIKETNPEYFKEYRLEYNKEYYKKKMAQNPNYNKEYYKKIKEQNPDCRKEKRKESRERAKKATDGYIRGLITTSSLLNAADIPPEFTEAYRITLLIKRQLKQKTQSDDANENQ